MVENTGIIFTILICLLLLIVTIVIYLAYKRMTVTDYRTFLKLEILNETSSVLCNVAKLKHNPEMYCITVKKQFLSVVTSMCRTIVLWLAGVQVENKFLGLPVAVPSRLSMWFWKVWLVRRIIRGDHYVVLHVIDGKGRLVDLVLIANPEMNHRPGSSAPPEPPLYPVMDKY